MKILVALLVLLSIISCKKDDGESGNSNAQVDFTVQNDKEIEAYIKANDLEAIGRDSGLYIVIEKEGTGKQPNGNSNVTVDYKGYYTNGEVFDESKPNSPISFGLNRVIQGWTQGIPFFKEGGSGKLLIPSRLGYGNQGSRGIPGGAVLIFDINLISVND